MEGIAHSSIKVYLSGVRQLHITRGVSPPSQGNMPRLQQVLRGIRISQASKSPPRRRLPIQPDTLRKIKRSWESASFIDEDKRMLWAAFTMAFFGFMRSGELCAQKVSGYDMAVTLSPLDVSVDNVYDPQSLKIKLKSSKTDPFREGCEIHLGRTHDDLCPVSAALSWMTIRGNSPGPLFRFKSGTPLTRQLMVVKLKEALLSAGVVPTGYSGHSFRAGAATTAAINQIEDSQIKLMGRWKSDAYRRYIRPSGSHLATLSSSLSTTSSGCNQTRPQF